MSNEYFWVPEDCIFEDAQECIGKHPGTPACLLASHVRYDELKKKLEIAREGLKVAQETIHDEFCSTEHHIFCKDVVETLQKIGE